MQKRKKSGLVEPVSFGSLRQRVRGGESERGAGGLLDAQPATQSAHTNMPSSPSRLIDVIKISMRLDSLRAPV